MKKRSAKAVGKKAAQRDLEVKEFASRDLGKDIRAAGGLRAILPLHAAGKNAAGDQDCDQHVRASQCATIARARRRVDEQVTSTANWIDPRPAIE